MKHNQNHFLAFIFSVFLFLPFSCSENESTDPDVITLKEAESIVFNKILNSNDSGKVVYELQTKLSPNFEIKTALSIDTIFYSSNEESWFFFIDDSPKAKYAHPCRYVFVICSTGNYKVYNEDYYPAIRDSLKIVTFR